jgi:hypothetical protein
VLAAASACPKAGGQARREFGLLDVDGPLKQLIERRNGAAIQKHGSEPSLRFAVPRIHRAKHGPQPLAGLGERQRPIEVRRRLPGEKVRLARCEELAFIGEVVIDRESLHTGAACDLGDGRPRWSDLLVKRSGGLDDAPARLPLTLCPRLQLVPSFLT